MSSAGGVGQRRQGKKRRAEGTAVARNEGGPVRPGQGYCRHTRQELPGYSPGRGGRLRHFAFRPDTARVAAQEPGIGPIFDRLDIAADVWVDPANNLPQRLDVRVFQPGREGTEVWTMTLTFRDYGQPVQITLPPP